MVAFFSIRKLRFGSTVLCATLLFLASCTKQTAEDPVPIIPPATPLPTNLCASSFSLGYTDKTSYLPGDKINAFLQSKENISLCRLDIYTIDGLLAFSVASPLTIQTISANDPSVNGYGFAITSQIEIPLDLKSGVYLIEKQVPFIVKTNNKVDFTIIYPSNTTNAYSKSGGKNLYDRVDRPSHVSFLRPIPIQSNTEYGLKWFASLSNYNIGYVADRDMDDFSSIQNSSLLIIVGHGEYWTRKARKNFDRFVDGGKDALILSGNTMWWQVRYSDNNQLICHKQPQLDPISDQLMKTIEWDNSSLQFSILSSIGADFPRGGYGLQTDNGWDGYKIVTPNSPLLEGLNLQKGGILSLPSGEYDGAPILNFNSDGYPVLDKAALNFEKIELIGFDRGSRGGKETIGTFIAFKKTVTSGIVINAASYDWCSQRGMGGRDEQAVKKITLNAIDKLLQKRPVFSE
jgi:hypothetical protein